MPEQEIAGLLADLLELERACEREQWELADTLMQTHDGRLRALLAQGATPALSVVLAAQQALLVKMAAARAFAAEQLALLHRAAKAVEIYDREEHCHDEYGGEQ